MADAEEVTKRNPKAEHKAAMETFESPIALLRSGKQRFEHALIRANGHDRS
jgi:hypothetical protein